jgi:transcriptional regulator with XRE-family HTH domain
MEILRKRLGRVVREQRTARGFSQEAFADHIGVHRTYMGAVERGELNISLDNIEKIARGLGITISTMFVEAEKRGRGG